MVPLLYVYYLLRTSYSEISRVWLIKCLCEVEHCLAGVLEHNEPRHSTQLSLPRHSASTPRAFLFHLAYIYILILITATRMRTSMLLYADISRISQDEASDNGYKTNRLHVSKSVASLTHTVNTLLLCSFVYLECYCASWSVPFLGVILRRD